MTQTSLLARRFGLPLALLLLCALAGLVQPSFFTLSNAQDVLTLAAPLCLVVIGQSFVILVRGLDLSVASVMATAAVIATAFNTTENSALASIVPLVIAMALLVGLLNGYLVAYRQVSPFLATLAVMTVLQGLRFYQTQGAPGGSLPEALRLLGTGRFGPLPLSSLLLLAVLAAAKLLLEHSSLGRAIYMLGGNPRAAALVGVRVKAVTLFCYALSAVLAALAGLVLVGYIGSVDNWVGRGYELDSVIAAVIGGIALTGGRGAVVNGVMGALILVVSFNLVVILGLPVQAQLILKGLIIISAATAFQRFSA